MTWPEVAGLAILVLAFWGTWWLTHPDWREERLRKAQLRAQSRPAETPIAVEPEDHWLIPAAFVVPPTRGPMPKPVEQKRRRAVDDDEFVHCAHCYDTDLNAIRTWSGHLVRYQCNRCRLFSYGI